MNNLLIEAILRSSVTVQPLWVVLGCAQRWQAAQAPVNGGVPPRKVHGGGGVELPAGGDEGSGVVEGVVGAASHPADLVVDLSQIGQLKQEKRSAAQRSRQETDLNFTFRGLRCKHKGVAYAKISMVQSKTTNWFKCSCGSSCAASVWMAHRQRDRRKFGLSCALQITLAVSTKTHTLWSPEVLKNLWMCLRGGVVCILTLSRLWPFVKKKKEKNYKRPWRHICSVSVTLGNVTLATALKST